MHLDSYYDIGTQRLMKALLLLLEIIIISLIKKMISTPSNKIGLSMLYRLMFHPLFVKNITVVCSYISDYNDNYIECMSYMVYNW